MSGWKRASLSPLKHDWTPDTLNKLVEICVFGGVMVDGLRGSGQNVHWITDDDSTVSTDMAKQDAITLMCGLLHKYPDERPEIRLGIASQFDDDLRAEDLVTIPDLAAGAYSETLAKMSKANMPTSGSGPSGTALFVQIKSSLINTWRAETDKPLKHMNAVIRPADVGQMLISFGVPFSRMLRPDESAVGAPTLNAKWRRALEADLKVRGVDPNEVLTLLSYPMYVGRVATIIFIRSDGDFDQSNYAGQISRPVDKLNHACAWVLSSRNRPNAGAPARGVSSRQYLPRPERGGGRVLFVEALGRAWRSGSGTSLLFF